MGDAIILWRHHRIAVPTTGTERNECFRVFNNSLCCLCIPNFYIEIMVVIVSASRSLGAPHEANTYLRSKGANYNSRLGQIPGYWVFTGIGWFSVSGTPPIPEIIGWAHPIPGIAPAMYKFADSTKPPPRTQSHAIFGCSRWNLLSSRFCRIFV